jgi:hypothetical protein
LAPKKDIKKYRSLPFNSNPKKYQIKKSKFSAKLNPKPVSPFHKLVGPEKLPLFHILPP